MQTFGGVEGVGKAARREKAVGFCGDGVTNFVQCLAGVRARAYKPPQSVRKRMTFVGGRS